MIHEEYFETWAALNERIHGFPVSSAFTHHPHRRILFRGQGNSEWHLDDTLNRRLGRPTSVYEYYSIVSLIKNEIETHLDSRWTLPRLPELTRTAHQYEEGYRSIISGLPGYEHLLFLRHNGFPSPLLDWSRSPYVAAYFAFLNSTDNDPAIFVLSPTEAAFIHSPGLPEIIRTGRYVSTHKRHFLQQAEYTICLRYNDDQQLWYFASHDEALRSEENRGYEVYKFTVSKKERLAVLKTLDQFNMNAFTLFGSTESLVETLAFRQFEGNLPISHPVPPAVWRDL
jgi:hypothetical protein